MYICIYCNIHSYTYIYTHVTCMHMCIYCIFSSGNIDDQPYIGIASGKFGRLVIMYSKNRTMILWFANLKQVTIT